MRFQIGKYFITAICLGPIAIPIFLFPQSRVLMDFIIGSIILFLIVQISKKVSNLYLAASTLLLTLYVFMPFKNAWDIISNTFENKLFWPIILFGIAVFVLILWFLQAFYKSFENQ